MNASPLFMLTCANDLRVTLGLRVHKSQTLTEEKTRRAGKWTSSVSKILPRTDCGLKD